MISFLNSLSPEQLAVIGGALAPIVHYFLTKFIWLENKYKSQINWLVSFGLPAVMLVGAYLYNDPGFNKVVPLYATLYATGQVVYYFAVSKWTKVQQLTKQLAVFTTPTQPVVTEVEL